MLRRNLIANYLGQGWTALMGLAFIPVYVRHLGIEAYGLIGLFAALQAWLMILDLGMTPTLGREMARFTSGNHTPQSIRTLLRSIEAIALLLAFVVVGGVWLASGWIATSWLQAQTLDPGTVTTAIGLIGVGISLRFVEALYRGAVVGLERQVAYNLVSAMSATLRAGGSVSVMVWVSPSILAFFIWQAVVSMVTVAVLVSLTYRNLPHTGQFAKPSLVALKPLYRFAGGMVVVAVLGATLTQLDKILLARMASLSEFGVYMLASTVAGAIYFVTTPIVQAFFPRLCALAANGDSAGFEKSYHMATQLLSVFGGSASIVFIFFSNQIIYMWTSDRYLTEEIAPLASMLALGTLLNGLMHVPYYAELAYGRTNLIIKIYIIGLVFLVLGLFSLVPTYGATGAASVWVLINVIYVIFGAAFINFRLNLSKKFGWYIEDVGRPIFLSIAAVSLFSFALPSKESGVISGVIYLISAMIFSIIAAFLGANQLRPFFIRFVKNCQAKVLL